LLFLGSRSSSVGFAELQRDDAPSVWLGENDKGSDMIDGGEQPRQMFDRPSQAEGSQSDKPAREEISRGPQKKTVPPFHRVAVRLGYYGLALLLVAMGVAVRVGLEYLVERPGSPTLPTYITFYPCVMLAALIGGLGPGILATIATAAVADYWLLLPPGLFKIDSTVDLVGLAFFCGVGTFMSIVAELYRRIRGRLEELVAARTAALSQANEQLQRLNRTLKALSSSSHALMRATEESAYLQDVCRIVVEDCGHAMVWVGYAEKDEAKSVRPVADAGFDEGYLETLRITWADTERGRGPTGTAIRTARPVSCHNMLTDPRFTPWRAEAIKRGYASSIALPLLSDGKTFGALTIYSRTPDPFSADEVRLLEELAADLAYGISSLRLRAAHAQHEQAMRESEAKYRQLVQNANSAIIRWKSDGTITFFNEYAQSFFGYSENEAVGKHVSFLVPERESTGADLTGLIRDVVEHPQKYAENVNENICRDGRRVWMAWTNKPIFDANGQVAEILAVGTDMTERKRAEQGLRDSEDRLRFALETNHTGAWDLDLENHTAFRSLEHDRIFGYAERLPRWTYEMFLEHIVPEDRAAVDAKFRQATATKGDWSFECRIRRTDGEVRWILAAGRHRADPAGGTRRMAGIVQDITERKQAEEALRQANEELERRVAERTAGLRIASLYARSLIEASLDPLVTISPDGKVTDVNEATEHVTGVSRDRLIGSDFSGYFTEPDKANAGYQKVMDEGLVRDYPLTIRHASGRTTDVLYNATVYRNEAGAVQGVFAAARDVTERKRAEAELVRYREHLEELVRERTGQLETANARLHESERRVRRKLESVLSPEGDLGVLDLADLIDAPALQKLMDDSYAVSHVPMAIIDIKGRVLVGVGWQDICTRFHRAHPETGRHCIESDTQLTNDLAQGESRLYKCKNNLWDMATPIFVAGQRVGNVFTGQFFFEDEAPDREFFIAQARKYGFDENEYLAALDRVPRLSRDRVDHGIAFLRGLADTLSQLGHSNIKLARLLAERDRLTDSLRQSEEQLKRAQQIARLGSWELDLRTDELTWSDEVYRLFGLDRQKFGATYEAFLERVHVDDRDAVNAAYSDSLSGNRNGYEIEHRVVRWDTGEVRIVHEKCEHIRDASGRIIRSVGMVHDITERKKAEEALRELNATLESKVAERTAELEQRAKQLQEAWAKVRSESEARIAALEQLRHEDRLKTVGKLASGIAHELGTPLNVISGYAGMIAGGSLSSHETTESARTIKNQSERIANIVRQILDFARRRPSQRMAVDLQQLARQTLDLMAPLAQKQNVKLILKDADGAAVVTADVEQMRQVLLNLIANAVQAMHHGGNVEVTIGRACGHLPADCTDPGRYVCVSVLDQGEGIPEENLSRIFEPFFTTKGPGKGTGLGLAIAEGIIREHGGWIAAESAPGKGSRFCVYLPKEEEICRNES
jgi:PAS domain S-box-containing protein